MTFLLDTNVLVYPHDEAETVKGERAGEVLKALSTRGRAALSAQALAEYASVTLRKFKLPVQEVYDQLEDLTKAFSILPLSEWVCFRSVARGTGPPLQLLRRTGLGGGEAASTARRPKRRLRQRLHGRRRDLSESFCSRLRPHGARLSLRSRTRQPPFQTSPWHLKTPVRTMGHDGTRDFYPERTAARAFV